MKYDPFIFTRSVNLHTFTPGQIHRARIRMAREFGLRGAYTPLAYIVLIVCLTVFSSTGMMYFKQLWPLELSVALISLIRVYAARSLSKAIPERVRHFQHLYFHLSLLTALLWGLMSAYMLADNTMQAYSYIVLTVCVALSAGAIGSMTQYHRV